MNEKELLKVLEVKFLDAMRCHQESKLDRAEELYKAILKLEPRLVEPNLELAHIELKRGRLSEAQARTEEAIRLCGQHGHWLDNFTDDQLLSLCYSTLENILKEQSTQDEIVFGDPKEFTSLINKAKDAYKKAYRLNKDNQHAEYWGGFEESWKED